MESDHPVICVPLCERTLSDLEQAMDKANSIADVVEIRVDCLEAFQVEDAARDLESLCARSAKPTIITYRPAEQGGKRELSDEARLSFWVFNRPNTNSFLDIEFDFAGNEFVFDYVEAPDWSRVICSYHDFVGMPPNLDAIYEQMVKTPARILKIAVQADDVVDCLPIFRLLECARKEQREVIPIAMGIAGIATRILGPSRGAFLTYASMDHETGTAPGQVTARELRETYRIDKLNRDTEICGVAGLPVSHSMSPNIHNAAFEASGINAVYIPFEVRDLPAFMKRMVHPRSREIEWKMRGLSITAPHKVTVMDHLDWVEPIAKEIGAVNTVLIEEDRISGFNTDALGFIEGLRAKEEELKGLRCAVIGSGGAARAAIWGVRTAEADVTVFSRDEQRAEEVGAKFKVKSAQLMNANFKGFDLVVNATSLGGLGEHQDQTPVSAEQLRGARLAYDLVYNPSETMFLREASKAGCETLGGRQMFLSQAARQFELWTGVDAPDAVMDAAMQTLNL